MEPAVSFVVSDLHFCAGAPREDFHADREFIGLLDHLERAARGATARLILNGDIVDFLKVDPAMPSPTSTAVGKLTKIQGAHRDVFDRLARFAAAGHRIVVLPGNHDVELAVSEVQSALRAMLSDGDAAVAERVEFPSFETGQFDRRLGSPHALTSRGVHVQHGNQFDFANAFEPSQLANPNDIDAFDLPVGSKFVFDVFNDLVSEFPWLDKVRPKTTAILLLWLIDPAVFEGKIRPLLGLAGDLLRSVRLHLRTRGVGPATKAGVGDSPSLRCFDFLSEEDLDVIGPVVRKGGIAKAVRSESQKIVHDRAAVARLLRRHLLSSTLHASPLHILDSYGERGLEIAKNADVQLVCFGHTHVARDVVQSGVRYMNTGTWIALRSLDGRHLESSSGDDYWALLAVLSDPALFKPDSNLTFVDFRYPAGVLEARICTWDSKLGTARPAHG